jgi:hypothetical protein
MLHAALAAAATLVALAFALSTFERWLARERPHELAWSLALAAFALASAALWAGVSVGWDGLTFRVFYLFGAIVNVPALALGSVYLLGGRRRGNHWALVVLVLSAFAAGVVAVAPFTGPLPREELARGSEVFGPLPRILAASTSGLGALVLVLGALWSAIRVRPPRTRLVTANVLIAVGTLITGASGLFNSVLDEMTFFAVALVAGISVIFAGFLVATTAGVTTSRARRPLGGRAAPSNRSANAVPSATENEELHQGRAQDEQEQNGHGDRDSRPHDGGSRVTASPGPRRSSSAAERRSRARETSP